MCHFLTTLESFADANRYQAMVCNSPWIGDQSRLRRTAWEKSGVLTARRTSACTIRWAESPPPSPNTTVRAIAHMTGNGVRIG